MEDAMIQYKVKGNETVETYLEILNEKQEGFNVLITCICEDYKKEMTEYMSKDLFDTCLRTGYITEIGAERETLISA